MRDIFLGKPWHWALLVLIIALMWMAGLKKLHVIEFNTFLVSLIVGTTMVIILVWRTTKPGEQVTRDVLKEDEVDER